MKQLALFFLMLLSVNVLFAQSNDKTTIPTPNYRLAAKFSPKNMEKLVHSTAVKPHWLKKGNRFWYQYKTTEGANYYLVDADKKSKTKLVFQKNKSTDTIIS